MYTTYIGGIFLLGHNNRGKGGLLSRISFLFSVLSASNAMIEGWWWGVGGLDYIVSEYIFGKEFWQRGLLQLAEEYFCNLIG